MINRWTLTAAAIILLILLLGLRILAPEWLGLTVDAPLTELEKTELPIYEELLEKANLGIQVGSAETTPSVMEEADTYKIAHALLSTTMPRTLSEEHRHEIALALRARYLAQGLATSEEDLNRLVNATLDRVVEEVEWQVTEKEIQKLLQEQGSVTTEDIQAQLAGDVPTDLLEQATNATIEDTATQLDEALKAQETPSLDQLLDSLDEALVYGEEWKEPAPDAGTGTGADTEEASTSEPTDAAPSDAPSEPAAEPADTLSEAETDVSGTDASGEAVSGETTEQVEPALEEETTVEAETTTTEAETVDTAKSDTASDTPSDTTTSDPGTESTSKSPTLVALVASSSVNEPPTASDGTLTTAEDTPAGGTLVGSDPESDPLTYTIVSGTSNGTATITDAQTGAYTYTPNANFSGSDSFTFKVNDGNNDSNVATITITITAVNDPPVITAGATLAYIEGDGAVIIDNTITITDIDSTTLISATITISGNFVAGQDVLAFAGLGNISVASWNAATGTLTLTGSDTLANYQAALRTVTYSNTVYPPNTSSRTISWTVTDSGGAGSNTATSTITVTLDQPPVITLGTILVYSPGDGARIIDPNITVSDPDDTYLQRAIIEITGNFIAGEDVIAFAGLGNITLDPSSTVSRLVLVGQDTVANYQAALRSITYQNLAGINPNLTSRTITYTVWDGILDSTPVSNVGVISMSCNAIPTPPTTRDMLEGTNLGVLDRDGLPDARSAKDHFRYLYGKIQASGSGSTFDLSELDLERLVIGKADQNLTGGLGRIYDIMPRFTISIAPSEVVAMGEVYLIDLIYARLPALIQAGIPGSDTFTGRFTINNTVLDWDSQYKACVRIIVTPVWDRTVNPTTISFDWNAAPTTSYLEVVREDNAPGSPFAITMPLNDAINRYNNVLTTLFTDGALRFFTLYPDSRNRPPLDVNGQPTVPGPHPSQAIPVVQNVDYYFPGMIRDADLPVASTIRLTRQ